MGENTGHAETSSTSVRIRRPGDDVRLRTEDLAWSQGGVISRRQLLEIGVERWRTRSYLRARRWRCHFRQTIAVHTGPLSPVGICWAGVFEAGPRGVLDGVSSLIAAGLTGYSTDRVRVSVLRGARVLRSRAIDVRQTRR